MTDSKTAAIILAAGKGTRMRSDLPKVLHPLAGRPMLAHLLDSLSELNFAKTAVVIGEAMDAVAVAASPHPTVVQTQQLGTGHAVLAARDALKDGDKDFSGDVLVLFGADPLISPDTITRMIEARHAAPEPSIVVLGFDAWEPGAYGRLVTTDDGSLTAIVEANDATPEQLEITLCNSGVMLIDGQHLWSLLERVDSANAKGEYYLTDIVALAGGDGLGCAVVEGDEDELLGIDDRADLACAEAYVQNRLRLAAMRGGATLSDPDSVRFSFDTSIGQDVSIGPNVVFGPGVSVGDNVDIRAFCHIEGAAIAEGAKIGPFARLRPGAEIGEDVHVGNFVEIKNATLETGAKANHLSYIGDARVGAAANIGAGTITCNYDGEAKHRTDIGDGAFIGSNTALVAPVTVGDGAVIGAGSVITKDVSPDSLALTRPAQKEVRNRKKTAQDKTKGKD
ncbi:MAG: bifunctional UDP-N-acetylglucosamine diphosphorylase/glucosamine-1-phosphate N-acetyltransferase GlmU [Rhodospirillales bacterium]|nr:bifunctional UDP-N-acetylglucosamine diphosphorylase/glucosamine-1-phosphate N-acetyltransferase GlmU [Alphaproteobacteria bacterium]MBL6948995.1 bifunctional UDP-N-acetylglucosamine diphosphorylase/glucosamine-1-phosphate N-acetyltransferase GlmU [Rhodospirillales bacterium]